MFCTFWRALYSQVFLQLSVNETHYKTIRTVGTAANDMVMHTAFPWYFEGTSQRFGVCFVIWKERPMTTGLRQSAVIRPLVAELFVRSIEVLRRMPVQTSHRQQSARLEAQQEHAFRSLSCGRVTFAKSAASGVGPSVPALRRSSVHWQRSAFCGCANVCSAASGAARGRAWMRGSAQLFQASMFTCNFSAVWLLEGR